MARIAIYIGRHLGTAPRPYKEACALAAAGHEVTVHGLWFDPAQVRRDRALCANQRWQFSPYADCQPANPGGRRRWWWLRARHRLARELLVATRRALPDAFGYGAPELRRHAEAHAADLTIVHSESGLWAARSLLARGRRVGVDFEDWFSHDLTPAERRGRPVAALEELERRAVEQALYSVTTSQSLARALAAAYGGNAPAVIYNTFPIAGAPVSAAAADERPVALHWFSLVIGPNRGLDTLFAALPHVAGNWMLNLRGDDASGYGAALVRQLPPALRERVRLLPTVPNAALPAAIAENDLGLALDVSGIPSRNLTITNKVFQYLIGGLALVASETAGHAEVLSIAPQAGAMFPNGHAPSLADVLSRFCTDRGQLNTAKTAARRAAERHFSQEHQDPIYVHLASRALAAASCASC